MNTTTNRSSLLDALQSKDVMTENGMVAHSTTSNLNLDLFFKVGAIRNRSDQDIINMFSSAYEENALLAMRILFHARDILQGKGERRVFRVIAKWLAGAHPESIKKNLAFVHEFGRFDDLLIFLGTDLQDTAFEIIAAALSVGNGLAAKWMPRKDKKGSTVRPANELRKFLGLTPKEYRKLLVENTNVVETAMCQKDWSKINFSHVPSVAMSKYRKAFEKNAPEAFKNYIAELQKPEEERDPKVKMNAKAIFPHQIIHEYFGHWNMNNLSTTQKNAIEAQWNALPNWINENESRNLLCMVDTSGSMFTGEGMNSPINVAVSLGLYTAERNKGLFANHFLTFNSTPQLQPISGSKLETRIKNMASANWGGSTNLESAFNLILNTAIKNKIPATDMPEMIIIISDMQFNSCVKNPSDTAFEMIRNQYVSAGYKIPDVAFWNVAARGNDVPVKHDERGTALISGFSPSILKPLLSGENFTPIDVMMSTINTERYSVITV